MSEIQGIIQYFKNKMAPNWWPLTQSRNQHTCICPIMSLMYMPSKNENRPWIAKIQGRTQKHIGFYWAKSLKWPPTGDLWPDKETNARAYVLWYISCMFQAKMKMVQGQQRYGPRHRRTEQKPLKWPPIDDLWPDHETNAQCICPMVSLMYMPSENGPWIAEIHDRIQKHMGFYGLNH